MTFFKRSRAQKYKNKTCKSGGRVFHSNLEAAIDRYLRTLESAGKLKVISRQEWVPLKVNDEIICHWVPDFTVEENGEVFYLEAKGFPTDIFKLKKKLYYAVGELKAEIWGGSAENFKKIETIIPKNYKREV